jgi:hypothetical protein
MNKKILTIIGVSLLFLIVSLGIYIYKQNQIVYLENLLKEKDKLEISNPKSVQKDENDNQKQAVKNIDDLGWMFLYEEGNQLKSFNHFDQEINYDNFNRIDSLVINKQSRVGVGVVQGEKVCEDEMYPKLQYQYILKLLIPEEKELARTKTFPERGMFV